MSINQDSKLAQRAALLAAIGAAFLAIIKLALFFATGSLIIALSAWDSTMDTVVSLINRKVVKFSRLDADDNHPYGHGRVESIAALGQGCLILGGALVIIFTSVKQIYLDSQHTNILPQSVESWWTVVFFIFATVFSYFITKYLYSTGKKLNSPALLADSEHYRVDFITNIASAVALSAVIIFKIPILDSFIASFFALYIIYGAFKLLRTSINELMDHDISVDIKRDVIALIHSTSSNVIDVHKLRGRKVGPRYYFDCHVTLPHTLSFNEMHEVVEKIEFSLKDFYGGDMTIHADPDNVEGEKTNDNK
ncbi:MAG: cation diffusion facilitator family transporter [Bdellovibrionota bacterium]